MLNRRHLRRLLNEYVRYYHEDRTHLGLGKDTPDGRVAASAPSSGHNVISLPRLGGLHHRYTVAASQFPAPNQTPFLSGLEGDSRVGLCSAAFPTRPRDAHSGRRPRHAKRCCPRKEPPHRKLGGRLVLMNHSMRPGLEPVSAKLAKSGFGINNLLRATSAKLKPFVS